MAKSNASGPELRIAIMGVGGIGSGFALKLAQAGHEVTVVARPGSGRLKQLTCDNAIVTNTGERGNVLVADALDEATAYDLVIVTIHVYQLGPVLPVLKRSAAERILFVSNNFNPEALRDDIGADRALFMMTFVGSKVDRESGTTRLTIRPMKALVGDQACTDIFNAAGLPSVYEPNILLWLRCHTPVCITFVIALAVAFRQKGGLSWAQSMTIARGIHECFALIRHLGYSLYPGMKAWMNRFPTHVLAAMVYGFTRAPPFREALMAYEGGTGHEGKALIEEMVDTADRVKAPVNIELIRAMKLGC